jgi:hypothetical protein
VHQPQALGYCVCATTIPSTRKATADKLWAISLEVDAMISGRSRSLFAAALMVISSKAHADAIDGDWCYAAQNLNIQGERIRTPAGSEAAGNYSRHAFDYIVPANETGAGTTVSMQLLGEETMSLTRASAIAVNAPEVWKRCKPIS